MGGRNGFISPTDEPCGRTGARGRCQHGVMSALQSKPFGAFEVKNENRGEVTAVVATLGVVDRDGDVILPGAIAPNKVKVSGWGHSVVVEGAPPVGIGSVVEQGREAVFKGKFFIGTTAGREAFEIVRELGPEGEWSVGFPLGSAVTAELTSEWRAKGASRVFSEVTLVEVSPVFRPAGFGTRTITAKGQQHDAAVAEFERFQQTVKRVSEPVGVPLADRFDGFLVWAADRFALSSSQVPSIRIVAPDRLRDGATGMYDVKRGAVLVRAGLDDETTRAVILHELAHHYEALKGWTPSEDFAYGQERRILAEWHHHNSRRGAA
jgi:hypothetical protein